MNIETKYSSLRDLVQWIDSNTKGIEISGDRRQQIAAACFDVAIEHQTAIALLCDFHLFGSMYAMIRVLIESVIRGLWILYCATDEELDRFETHGIDKYFGDLIKEIENVIGDDRLTLSQMKTNAWNALNDFTHTGYIQITRWHGNGKLGSNYPEEDVIKCINAAGAYGLIASMQLSLMAKQEDFAKAHLKKITDFASEP
jgi:hypothetical protein